MKDNKFIRAKVPMTKEPIRAMNMAWLKIHEATSFLDIGAGTGSVTIQAAKTNPNLQVTAIEYKDDAVDLIQQNIEKFNLNNIDVIQGMAPDVTLPLDKYDAIFIGGSKGQLQEIIEWSQELLSQDGVIVLNFILIENALEAYHHLQEVGFESLDIVKIDASNLTSLGSGHYFKPNNPTYIIRAERM